MGWASAGAIFDRVADGLIAANASDTIKEQVLGDLIGSLQDGDWDTERGSLELYRDDPAIVRAFAAHNVSFYDDEAINAGEIAEALTSRDGIYDDRHEGWWSIDADGPVITGTFTPADGDGNAAEHAAVHFRADVTVTPPPAGG